MPLLSIITVTLNNLEGLQRTSQNIKSASDIEWIVIDGGSNGGTQDFANTLSCTYIKEPDNGIYHAMNKGIRQAEGDYVIFMNAGDCFAGDQTLQKLISCIENHKPDFLYADAFEKDEDKLYQKKSRSHYSLPLGMFTHHQAMVYKREIIKDLLYDETYKIAADYKFTLQALRKSSKIIFWPEALCVFEAGGISQQKAGQGRIEQYKIRKEERLCPPFVNSLIYYAQFVNWHIRKFIPSLYWPFKRHSLTIR